MNEKVLHTLEYDKIIEKLVHYAVSPMGKKMAGELVPSSALGEIVENQKETTDAVSMSLRKGGIPLGGLKDIRSALKRVRVGGVLSIAELLYVADVLRVCRKVKNYAKDERKQEVYETLDPLFAAIEVLAALENEISRCILSEEEVADDASTALKEIRRDIKISHDRVKEQLNRILHSSANRTMLQDAVITIRGDRYCIPVKQEYKGSFPGMIHDQSATGATLFIEPMAVVQLNNKIKELQIKEKAEIEKILRVLSGKVGEYVEILDSNLTILTKLDFVFAKAQLSLSMDGISPVFNDRGYLHIKKGRHPLLDPKTVVPTDIYLGGDFTTLMITGPNTGGKTVTLKTIGLFSLLGQAGLHIPAFDNSELAVFDEVFADIGDEQSIEQSLSTFSSHMTNIVHILEHVTDRSLVLFDELGAGTDPTEGAALAMSILQYLHDRGIRTVATTHYSELKVYALSTERVENASCEFSVETLRPTYKLLIGIPGKSNAFAISRRLGLPEYIIDSAKEFITHEDERFEDLITDLEISKKTVLYEKDRAEQYRREAEVLKQEVEKQKAKIQAQKDKILLEAKQEARRILQGAKDESDQLIKDIQKAAREAEATIQQKELEEARQKLKSKLGQVEDDLVKATMPKKTLRKVPKALKPGDKVFIASLNQTGVVIAPPDHNQDVMIQAGIMKIKIHITNLSLDESEGIDAPKPRTKGSATKPKTNKSQHISTEIDCRGQLADEAIKNIDKYLDDAYLAGLPQVTIIHGKGTGALRAAVHQHLSRHPHVKSYRLGKYGEGETGVTVVEF